MATFDHFDTDLAIQKFCRISINLYVSIKYSSTIITRIQTAWLQYIHRMTLCSLATTTAFISY
jgi:hypothetical protein